MRREDHREFVERLRAASGPEDQGDGARLQALADRQRPAAKDANLVIGSSSTLLTLFK